MLDARASRTWLVPAILFSLLFLLYGILIVPYPGIQNDEALFAAPLYDPAAATWSKSGIPVMLMDYLGCLKTWIYGGIFRIWPPSVWSLRVPVIAIGAVSIFLFTKLVYRAGGLRAAWIGAALLASDPAFALTNDFDWGPVALQHLLLIGSLLSLCEFHALNRTSWLALAAFGFGLALWDKALFSWVLLPVLVSAVTIWPHAVLAHAKARNIAMSIAGFLIGASPLLYFNLLHHWITFRSHLVFSSSGFAQKLTLLHYTADGSVLFGYMVRGERRADLLEWGGLIALCVLPFLWRTAQRQTALFSLSVAILTWLQMALVQGTGGAAHHAILLWPMPQLFIAVVFSRLKYSGIAIGLVLVLTNCLVLQRYAANLRNDGPSSIWTDAIEPLSWDLPHSNEPVSIVDWGLTEPLRLLSRGTIPVHSVFPAQMQSETDRKILEDDLRNPQALWLSHVDGEEQFAGVNERLVKIAATYGLLKKPVRVYNDLHGHPIFQSFRFTTAPQP